MSVKKELKLRPLLQFVSDPFFVSFLTDKSQFTDVPTVVSALVEEPEAKIFNADHPFIFYVKVKGVVLFGGRVVEPKL
jgi:serine protease inhibitor